MHATDDRPAAAVPAGLEIASFGRRVGGAVIDEFVVLAPVALGTVLSGYRPGDDISADRVLVLNGIVLVVGFVYETLMIGVFGRTLGKLAVGTRAVRADTGGRLPWFSSVQRALVPAVAGALPAISLLLASVVYGSAFLDPLRRGIHDRASGSLVVRADDVPRDMPRDMAN